MCSVDKCCLYAPLHIGCYIIGIISFIASTALSIVSIVLLVEEDRPHQLSTALEYLILNRMTVHVLLVTILIFSLLWMCFSVLLVVGMRVNKSSLVVSHFLFGILVTIVMHLTSLLLLLQGYWILPAILSIISMFYIHGLTVIYSAYERLEQGKLCLPSVDDEERLIVDLDLA